MVKIKEVKVTANYAWSPAENHPIYIAAGTAAQQLDATFSSNSKLELYEIDMTDSGTATKCAGHVETSNRFQKVVWGSAYPDSPHTSGLIVCGTDKGRIEIYNPDKILNNEEDCLVLSTSKHSGPVGALDFNPFQKNLFASGAGEREIFIWDMKNPGNPMTPGAKTQPIAPISSIAWNRQVEHILASTSAITSGPCCVVWDLRKNEPIIKVQDPSGRMQCSDVAWHPEVATQLVLSSEDDHSPVVQLWDLRFATSPMKVLERHRKGVMSVSWCPRDPDLLLSCGKDNQVYCWNPNTSPPEVVYELETNAQWCFDVQWCPRNPNVVSTGSFDGKIIVHSLMGGGVSVEDVPNEGRQRSAVDEAFGTSPFPAQQSQAKPASQVKKVPVTLKKPPKWMRKPCGASFVFGGKLVSFAHNVSSDPQQNQNVRRTVTVSQIVTEVDLLERSAELRSALLDNVQCSAYCQKRLTAAKTEFEEDVWSFLKVNFEAEPRQQYLRLLGYSAPELKTKFNSVLGATPLVNGELTSKLSDVSLDEKNKSATSSSNGANESANSDADVFDQIASNQQQTPPKVEAKPMVIPVSGGDLDSMISQALLIGDYEAAVDLCIHGNRMTDAIVIANAGGSNLLEKTQKRYFAASDSKLTGLLSAVVTKDWSSVVRSCELENWKDALASLLTYAAPDELVALCDELGARLQESPSYQSHACLCYICSGNIERLVQCWDKVRPHKQSAEPTSTTIQDLIEKIMVLFRVVEMNSQGGRTPPNLGEASADKMAEYASLLAAQGELGPAMEILPRTSNKEVIRVLQDRLFHAQSDLAPGAQAPPFPFAREGAKMGGQRPEVQVQPQRRGYGMQNQAPNQLSNSVQPHGYQPNQRSMPQPQPIMSQPNPAPSNPYASQPRSRYPGASTAPSGLYTPQPAANSSPGMMSSPMMMPVHSQVQQPAPFQPYAAPVSNGPTSLPPLQPSSTPVPIQGQPPMQGGPGAGDLGARKQVGGWNDPPAMDPNRIPRKKKQTMQPALNAGELNLMTPTAQPKAPHPGLMGQHVAPGAPMMGAYPPQQPLGGAPAQQPAPNMMMQDMQQAPAPVASVPTGALKDVPKDPIPQEHQVLQTQFGELIQKCANHPSANAQTKRKITDCTGRLEFLYDKLRANSLSPNVIGGLHQVAQSIQMRDYAGGLRHHQQIVSHSNFSEISAFMPGVKSLLQIATNLRI